MAMLDPESRKRLVAYFYEAFDEDNAGSMEAFAQNFLHNGAVFDLVADNFPKATMSAVKQAMMEAYGLWEKARAEEKEEG
ncbi:MAG TPA: hypothetical protein VLL76_09770 [Candidatus Omnitrophota bacterium]|nr:hypothetical protein [Candidatus Omnitrophota bacterium]